MKISTAAAVLCLIGTGAVAQTPASFALTLNAQEVNEVYAALATQPYAQVAPLIENLRSQVAAQNAAAQAKANKPPVPPEREPAAKAHEPLPPPPPQTK